MNKNINIHEGGVPDLQSKGGRGRAGISRTGSIEQLGMDICSPISGSMLPMIRPRRDSALFIPPKGRLKRYDVALYKRGTVAVMHRVIRVKPDGYIVRGDNAREEEFVSEDRVFGVMKGFYRDEYYIPAEHTCYRFYARVWVALNPLLIVYKKMKQKLYRMSGGKIR